MNTEKTGCDIQAIAEEKLQLIIDNGTISKIIEDKLIETCKSIISDTFRDYSEFGKSLKKVINEKLEVNLNNINLGTYSAMILRVVEENMVGILETQKDKVKEAIVATLQLPEKKEWKLSEIVAKYRSGLYEHKEVAIEVEEPQYSSIWVRIGEKKETNKYSYSSSTQEYEIRLLINVKDKKISGIWHDGKMIDPRKERIYTHNIEAWLMNLWAYDCTIELDTDEAEYEATKDQYED